MTAKPDRAQYPSALPGSFIGTLAGELIYTIYKETNGLIQIYRHDDLHDGNSELVLAAWAPTVIELRRAAAESADS